MRGRIKKCSRLGILITPQSVYLAGSIFCFGPPKNGNLTCQVSEPDTGIFSKKFFPRNFFSRGFFKVLAGSWDFELNEPIKKLPKKIFFPSCRNQKKYFSILQESKKYSSHPTGTRKMSFRFLQDGIFLFHHLIIELFNC